MSSENKFSEKCLLAYKHQQNAKQKMDHNKQSFSFQTRLNDKNISDTHTLSKHTLIPQ